MKLKLACASAVLTFLCCDPAWGGALKNSFTKNKTEVESQNKEAEKGEEAVQASETSSKPTEQASAEQAQSKEVAEKKEIKGNPVIFKIGNKEIRRNEILADIKTLPAQLVQQTPADKLFDIMKRQKLMTYLVIEQAKKAGVDREKEYIQQIDKLKERVLFESYLVKELEPKASNETTLKQKYQQYLVEFKSGKEIKISTIALNTEKEAKDVINALNKGAPFDKLQKDKGLSALSENSDRYVPVSRMPEDLKNKFKKVTENAVTKEPVKIADAYHVLKITDMRDSKPGTFEEVKPILSQLILRDEMEKLIKKLENQYKVQKFNEDGTPEVATPSAKTPAV